MQKLLLNHKKYIIFIIFLSVVSLLIGFYYFNSLDIALKTNIADNIKNNTINMNFIFKDLVAMSTIIVTSFFLIGLPLCVIYYSYNIFIIGFFIKAFLITYKSKGIIYLFIYVLINRLLPILLFTIFMYKVLIISKYIVNYIFAKNKCLIEKIYINCRKSVFIILFITLINIISYLLVPLFKI